jgi:hypothetical protein
MNLVEGNEAGLGHTGSGSLYNKEIRISITRQEIELTAVMLVNAFVRPVLVDTMTVLFF